MDTNQKADLEYLIEKSIRFAEEMLIQHEEFFPYSYALHNDGSIVSVNTFDGHDKPLSQNLINDLKKALTHLTTKNELKAISIYYNVVTSDPNTDSQTDAIAALVEHLESDVGYIFYYPYEVKRNQLDFGNSFGESIPKEILIKDPKP